MDIPNLRSQSQGAINTIHCFSIYLKVIITYSIPQLCSIVVIVLILLVLLFIAPLFFHLPKVTKD